MRTRRQQLCGGRAAPRLARRAVRDALRRELSPGMLVDVELLVSELATNSVRHAGCDEEAQIAIDAQVRRDRVRVRLCDPGHGFVAEPPPEPSVEHAGGYGLVLLDRLAEDWGVSRGERFCVWFELDRT
jgi:anti-sigma regulatory factor (Ser/Thr protein kinase)